MTRTLAVLVGAALVLVAGCRGEQAAGPPTASGYVEATEIKVASKVPGRVADVRVVEGARVDRRIRWSSRWRRRTPTLAMARAQAERAQAQAQLRLLQAGSRPEDIQQAEAQVAAATLRQARGRGGTGRRARTKRASSSSFANRAGATSSATTRSRAGNWPKRGSQAADDRVRGASRRRWRG